MSRGAQGSEGRPGARRGRHGKARHHRLRWGAPVIVAVAVAVVWLQLARAVPQPVVHRLLATTASSVTGAPPNLPWPAVGQGAVSVPGRGLLVQSGPEKPVPIASLTKMMTAYVVLRDHPLSPTAAGPTVTVDAADQLEADADDYANATSVPVQAGEVLTERQLLDGLLVHSANNFADILARWDAGSLGAFVARMNAQASALAMTATHYADASGLDPSTVSVAGDQLRVAMAAMANPTFAAVVRQTSIDLPIAGVIQNFVRSIGTDGIVGVKSGFTQAAMGCLVLAADRLVDGRTVVVMAAVTGQPGLNPLDAANTAASKLIDAAAGALQERSVLGRGTRVASVAAPWLADSVPADTDAGVTLLAWPGDVVRVRLTRSPVHTGARVGTRVGTVTVSDGSERFSLPVLTMRAVTPPPLRWRLERP